MRQTLRFLLFDGDWELCFPATLVETNDERVEAPNVSNALIRVFCDASHAPMKLTRRRGISGAFFFALGSLIKGFSRHQTCTSLSSCESEMFGIQETAQEALGLLPMVRRLVLDFFGDLAGYDGRVIGRYSKEKFAIQILTDSESAKQLLSGLDIPRRSRHTEVRVYWLRDRMRKYITITWIAGEFNLSDILTKCSTYHFQHRASCGFVKVAPANVSEVLKRKQTKPQVALILVELCCQEDSGLKSVNTAFGYIGVTEKCVDMKTYKDVRARIDVLRNAARASGLDCHVHFHVSCPCTAGSPVRSLRSPVEDDDIRFGELEPILRRLPSYKRLSDSMSLEWPVNNKLWGLPGVKSMLVDLELSHEAVIRLCRFGYVGRQGGLPVGKRLRFVSTSEAFCKPLRRYQQCTCAEHAPLNAVDWSSTGFYNAELSGALNGASKAGASAAASA